MSGHQDIEVVQDAKRKLMALYEKCAWYRGAGIVPAEGGFGLRLNVDPDDPTPEESLPHECDGIPVEIVRIGHYRPRT